MYNYHFNLSVYDFTKGFLLYLNLGNLQANKSKLMFLRITAHVLTAYCNFNFFMEMETPKMVVFLLLNGTQYVRPKIAVRSTQSPNRSVRSTQGGRGVSPSIMLYYHFMETRPIKNISCLNPQHIISIKTLSVASTKHMIQHCGIDALNQNTD